jgi:nucleotide-binding universal stress UspA family protein
MSLLIVPTDYSPNAEKALDQALLIAAGRGDQVELLHVVEITRYATMPKVLDVVMANRKEEEAKLKDLLERRVKAIGISDQRRRIKVIYSDDLMNAIVNRFRQIKAKLAVVGSHGVSGLGDKLLGSNTSKLIGIAKIPVLAIPPQWTPSPIKKFSVCMQPDQVAHHAGLIKKWGKWFGVEVEGFYFSAMPVENSVVKGPFPFHVVPDPIETPLYQDLVDYSKNLKDEALVMLVHQRSFFEKIFDSSITKKVASYVQIPLLAVPV